MTLAGRLHISIVTIIAVVLFKTCAGSVLLYYVSATVKQQDAAHAYLPHLRSIRSSS